MTDLENLETRVRHTLHTVAFLPSGALEARKERSRPRHSQRAWQLAAVSFALAAVAVIAIALVTVGSNSHRRVITNQTPEPRALPTSTTVAPAPVDAGVQQQLESSTPPFTPYHPRTPMPGQMTIKTGTAHSFTVAGSPPFEVADATVSPDLETDGKEAPAKQGVATQWVGVGGLSGTADEEGFQPYGSQQSLIQIIPGWPLPGKQLYVWPHLPAGTAYVTYTYEGTSVAWERPQYDLIALLVPRPAAFDGNYSTWHTAPLGVLTAYSDTGQVLQQLKAPRIGGDDLKVTP